MSDIAQVRFGLEKLTVFPLLTNGTYGGKVDLDYGDALSFGFEADTDEMKAYGFLVERMAIPSKVTGTFAENAMENNAFWILTGMTASSNGTTPNQTSTTDILLGGSGLPYFGVIGYLKGTTGQQVVVGLRKCQLDTIPEWKVESNKFVVSECAFTGMAINSATRKAVKVYKLETAVATTLDPNTFLGA